MEQNKTKTAYWQPEFDNNGNVIGHESATVYSFQVWKKKKNLLQDYPNCKPLPYSSGAIEEPTYMD